MKIIKKTVEQETSVSAFLNLIDRDINQNSNIVQPLTKNIFEQATSLTKDIKFDLDEELLEDFIFP
jgi:hypothetical protein